jgi:CubicO group peptidase (beta-lactamase class C family)
MNRPPLFPICLFLFSLSMAFGNDPVQKMVPVYPGTNWDTRKPNEVGLSLEQLDALRDLVGGRGCIVRYGYLVYSWGDPAKSGDIASAVKPVISTLLLLAIQEGKLQSVDDKVADFESRLKTLNDGKDTAITWRHLASQTSGYGLTEVPGKAYSYNDFALALYYDVLTEKVYQEKGTAILKNRIGDILQFQDPYTFEKRPGRLSISVRDFSRFGLLYLRSGKWKDKQVVDSKLIQTAISSPISKDTPLTAGKDSEMLPHQRSIGGSKNITPIGPGYYSFNWWLNKTDKKDQRLFVDAPEDAYIATGHGGKRVLWLFPKWDLIVCWNDSPIDDHDQSPGNSKSKCNLVAKLIQKAILDK